MNEEKIVKVIPHIEMPKGSYLCFSTGTFDWLAEFPVNVFKYNRLVINPDDFAFVRDEINKQKKTV